MLSTSNSIYPFVFETSRAYNAKLRESGLTVDAFNASPVPDELASALKSLGKSAATGSGADNVSSLTRGYAASVRALTESIDIASQDSRRNRHVRRGGWLNAIRDSLTAIPTREIALVALKAYQSPGNRDEIIGKCFVVPEDLASDSMQQDIYLAGINVSLVYTAEYTDPGVISQIAKAAGKQQLQHDLKKIGETESLDMRAFLE